MSAPAPPSAGFHRLDVRLQRWIWEQNWTELRDIQERTILAVLDGEGHVIVSAATAGGKTEAAFLPILSSLAEAPPGPGFGVLALSPLKALINDQHRRLEPIGERVAIGVHPWHGDVDAGRKDRVRRRPEGLLLITPESLEALLLRRAPELGALFGALRFVVIDELHAFLVSERGTQLASLLARLEHLTGVRPRRVGLSATLGDMSLAARALDRDAPDRVLLLESAAEPAELRLQIRGYTASRPRLSGAAARATERGEADLDAADEDRPTPERAIATHLFETLRGSANLVFGGSRQKVESYADRLRELAEDRNVPNEFLPHHGSLARGLRHEVEARLKQGRLPTTAVCTTTLELGIDIGDVESVAQIDAPRSVAALRQRLGRSGRRPGKPAVLRIYTTEQEIDGRTPLLDRLRRETVLAVAAVRLLLARWCEPPPAETLQVSTLLHQILAQIRATGAASAAELFDVLCRKGPFRRIEPAFFAALLRRMSRADSPLLEQDPSDGTLMLGEGGERLVDHYSFYAVFHGPREYRVEHQGQVLGTIPVDFPLYVGALIIFAGRRWRLVEIREEQCALLVAPAKGGTPPRFGGEPTPLHGRLVEEMRAVYHEEGQPAFLDRTARSHLAEGREAFRLCGLARRRIVDDGGETLLFPWCDGRRLNTLFLALVDRGFDCHAEDIAITVCHPEDEVLDALDAIAKEPPPDPLVLAERVANKFRSKFDHLVGEELLCHEIACRDVEAAALPEVAAALLGRPCDRQATAAAGVGSTFGS